MTGARSWRERLGSPVTILAVAALLRLALVLVMGQRVWFYDTEEYAEMARWMLHGQGFPPGNARAPLFPAMLAVAFRVAGDGNWLAAGLLNVVPGVLLVAVTMRLGRVAGGPVVGRLAGWLTAIMPMQVFTTALLYPTTIYALCLTALVLLALELAARPNAWRGAAFGAVLVAGWLADQVFVAPAAVVGAWLAGRLRARGPVLLGALAVAIVVAGSLAAPYVVWRRSAFQANAVFLNKAQFVQYYGRSDSLTNRSRRIRLPADSTWQALPLDAYVRQELGFMRTRPLDYLHDYAFEVVHFWQPLATRIQTRNAFSSDVVRWLGALVFLPIVVLQWIGLLAGRAPFRSRVLLMLVPLAIALFYGFFFTQARYRVPSEPMMLVLSALALERLFPRTLARLFGGEPERR